MPSLRPALPRDRLILVRSLLPLHCRSSSTRAAAAGSYLISFILPRFSSSSSSSSFRVPTSIVSWALINYPEGHPIRRYYCYYYCFYLRGQETSETHSPFPSLRMCIMAFEFFIQMHFISFMWWTINLSWKRLSILYDSMHWFNKTLIWFSRDLFKIRFLLQIFI